MPNPTSFATTDGAELRYIERIYEGGVFKLPSELDTPGNDNYTVIPMTGEGLAAPLTSKISDAITSSGQYQGSTVVGGTSGGTVNFEMQNGSFDVWLKGVVRSEWSVPTDVTGSSDIDFTASSDTIASTNATPPFTDAAGFTVGAKIKVFLVSESSVHKKEYTIETKATDASFTVVEDISSDLTGTSVVIKPMPMLTVGDNVTVMDFEKVFSSNAGDSFAQFKHQQVGAIQLTISPEDFVQGQATFLGNGSPTYTASTVSDSVIAYPAQNLMATTDLMEINLYEYNAAGGQGALVDGTFSSLTINIDGALREQKAPGSTFAAGIARNRLEVSLSGPIYFTDYSLEAAHLAESRYAIVATMRDVLETGYIFEFNRCKIQEVQSNASSADSDIDKPLNFRAFEHPVDSTVRIFKIPIE